MQGCATTKSSPVDPLAYKKRTESSVNEDVTVTVAVPTIAEAQAIYGVELASKHIQPVWLEVKSFSFIIADPDFKADHKEVDFETIYAAEDIINIEDEEELRRVLEELPCCVSNENGGLAAEPLNVVIIGAIDDWTTAFDEIH